MATATAPKIQRRQFRESLGFACEGVEENKICGVKLVGMKSKNGRRYTEQSLRDAATLYEGAHVCVNHPKGSPSQPRDYQERLAGISNVRFKVGEGLFGDLNVNPKHPVAESAIWDAKNNTRGVGLSHNVMCESRRESGETIIESIVKVNSVDLVIGPATTNSFFEQESTMETSTLKEFANEHKADAGEFAAILEYMESDGELSSMPIEVSADVGGGDAVAAAIRAAAVGILDSDLDIAGKLAKIKQLLKIGEAPEEKPAGDESGEPESGSTEATASEQRIAAMERRMLAVSVLAEQEIPVRKPLLDELVKLPTYEAMQEAVGSWPQSKSHPSLRPSVETDVTVEQGGGGNWKPTSIDRFKQLIAL